MRRAENMAPAILRRSAMPSPCPRRVIWKTPTLTTGTLKPRCLARASFSTAIRSRQDDTLAVPAPSISGSAKSPIASREAQQPVVDQQPAYQITFTCKPCLTRASHRISKQGYHKGSVLIQCPNCKARHVISDHLKIFSDTSRSLEDILHDGNETIRHGKITDSGDVEFWGKEADVGAT